MQTEFARAQMITQQVRAWDVLDERVLDAMRRAVSVFPVALVPSMTTAPADASRAPSSSSATLGR